MPSIAQAAKFSRWVLSGSDHARVATCTYDENLGPKDWQESYVRLTDREELDQLIRLSKTRNVFVCSAAFDDGHKFSHSKVVWVDIDSPRLKDKTVDQSKLPEHMEWLTSQESTFRKLGAMVVASGSEGGRHVRVRVDRRLNRDELEKINRLLAKRFRGDSKFPFNALLRLPGTVNHKTKPGVEIEVLRWGSKVWDVDELVKYLGSDLSLAEIPSTPSSNASSCDGEPFDLQKRKYAGIRETIRDWDERFEADSDMSRYAAAKAIVMETAKAGLTVDNAVWAARQCKPLVDKEETERGYKIHTDIPKVWDKEGAEKYAVRANRHLQPVPDPSSPEGEVRGRFDSIDWTSAWQQDFSKLDWLAGEFVEVGQQLTLAAEGKAGKSLLILDWCRCLVLGLPFLTDKSFAPLKVLYFDKENSLKEIVTRLKCLGITQADLPILQERFIYKQFPKFDGTLDDPAGVAAEELLEIVDEVKPDVVILDTASRFIGGNENESSTWLNLYRLVHEPLKARKIVGIRIDHFGKDTGKGMRGSSAKSQDVDHVWELHEERDWEDNTNGEVWKVHKLKFKRTHTRTGHGDEVYTIIRKGKKTPEKTWAEGCTSHTIEGKEDLIQSVVVGMNESEALLNHMASNVGMAFTISSAKSVLEDMGIKCSDKTVERYLKGFVRVNSKTYEVKQSRAGRANTWTYYLK
jgi:hypothetical protein